MTREEAIQRLKEYSQYAYGIYHNEQKDEEAFDMAIEALKDRPKGEWIPCTKGGLPLTELSRREGQKWYGYKCSKCNFIYKGNALTESPFCQNCGADMRGGDDE